LLGACVPGVRRCCGALEGRAEVAVEVLVVAGAFGRAREEWA